MRLVHVYAYNVYLQQIKGVYTANDEKDILTSMSVFLKNQIYAPKTGSDGTIQSLLKSEFSPIPAILYAIFVFQSIMYFIAYMRRFFYIITLALFAPLVVLYDFLSKAVSV